MANKVDIRKLIKKKYGEDTLDLPDLLEEIDLVLNEMYDYGSKHNTTDILPISEDPKQSIRIAAVNGNSVPLEPEVGAPRNARPDSDQKRWYHADKIAEQGASEQAKTYNLKVPDIFSMITNSQMEVGSEDRELIKRMVRNLPTDKGNWFLRIQKINEFTQTANKPVETKDIRSAISALLFLNLLKKLSFFTAQPGKLFEYVLAPIIGADAKVMGSVDKQIIDVTKESQGEIWNYSLKMFTGKDSSFLVKGSLSNLKETVAKSGRPITYILAAANAEQGKLEFSELLISPEETHFEGWQRIKLLDQGVILVKDNTVGILVILKDQYKGQHAQYVTPEKEKEKRKAAAPKLSGFYDNPVDISVAEQNLKNLNNSIEIVEKTPTEKSVEFLKKSRAGSPLTSEEDAFIKAFSNIISQFIKTAPKAQRVSPGVMFDLIRKVPDSEKIKMINNYIASGKKHSEALEKAIQDTLNPPLQEETLISEEEDKKTARQTETTQFSIPLKGSWSLIPNKTILNLGDAKIYNQQQLTIASELGENIENTFKAFQELNTNLVNFFATSKENAQSENYGDKAIENADTISSNIAAFQEKEKTEQEPK
jgi:hypothetical protein